MFKTKSRNHEVRSFKTMSQNQFLATEVIMVLAGNQWWPHTSGGRLRLAHAITHVSHHRFGHFVKGNIRNIHKNE